MEKLNRATLSEVASSAKSAANFATHCMRRMFTVAERLDPKLNQSGLRGKVKMSPESKRLNRIHHYVSLYYNVANTEAMRQDCIVAMDTANRRYREQHAKKMAYH